ncbi:hypothetical protein HMSP1_20 [Sinorhizobium phage HMSP1-Susan]|nr:hypothetical protein HMSP1_20 [Sinorhizobium phage HMSP1-Susan]
MLMETTWRGISEMKIYNRNNTVIQEDRKTSLMTTGFTATVQCGSHYLEFDREDSERLINQLRQAFPVEPDVTTKAYQEFDGNSAPPAPGPLPQNVSNGDMTKFLVMYRHAKQVGWI